MTVGSGWAEFNDATAKLRGVMVAGKGTFSGSFTADSVDAIDSINIRDGAVSASYAFQNARVKGKAMLDMSFTIPAQPLAPLVEMIVPAHRTIDLGMGDGPTYSVYRNGVLIETINGPVFYGALPLYGDHSIAYMDFVLRFVDYQAPAGQSITYHIVVYPGSEPRGQIWGTAFVNCRKK